MPATKENLISIINPSNGEIISEIKSSTEFEIKEKVQKAKNAFPLWSSLSVEKRIVYLQKI